MEKLLTGIDFSEVKLAIFDMDGLIFDTERLFMAQKDTVMQKYGYQQKEEDYLRTIGTGGENLKNILADMYGEDYPADTISRETRERVNNWILDNGPPVKKGIPELLEWMAVQKIRCCVATSTDSDIAGNYLEFCDLRKYMSFIIGGDQIDNPKPDPEIFLKACRTAGIDPDEAVVLEDSPNGVKASSNAGIPVIIIRDLVPLDEESRTTAKAVFDDAQLLLDNLKQ